MFVNSLSTHNNVTLSFCKVEVHYMFINIVNIQLLSIFSCILLKLL